MSHFLKIILETTNNPFFIILMCFLIGYLLRNNNTKIPSRSRAILFNETSPLADMLASCKKLESYPVDVIVIPCNSAIYWMEEIKNQINIPILNTVEVAVNALKKQLS